jgi:hypothetical protein
MVEIALPRLPSRHYQGETAGSGIVLLTVGAGGATVSRDPVPMPSRAGAVPDLSHVTTSGERWVTVALDANERAS